MSSPQNPAEKANEPDYLILSHNIELLNANSKRNERACKLKETSSDTFDLCEDNTFNFKELKRKYINNLISWSFIKKISDLFQWPLGCFGNLIDNSFIHGKATRVDIDVNCYDKKVYDRLTQATVNTDLFAYKKSDNNLSSYNDYSEKHIVLSVKDNGKGISIEIFNKILLSFGNKEGINVNANVSQDYFYQFGVTMKASCIRLANSIFFLSKTENELSIGLISHNLQTKLNTDLILTPIVNYELDKDGKYKFKSQFSLQSANLILNEIKFLFYDIDEIFAYANGMKTGTHIFIFDLKQLSKEKNKINTIDNFELYFDTENNDILYNLFYLQTGNSHLIDSSFKMYLENLYIRPPYQSTQLYLFGKKILLNSELRNLFDNYKEIMKSKEGIEIITNSNFSLKIDHDKEINCLIICTEMYQGVLIKNNKEYIEKNYGDVISYNNLPKGIYLYLNNRLVNTVEQRKLGDASIYLNKTLNKKKKNNNSITWVGYVELPTSLFELIANKTEFRDLSIYLYFYSKLFNLIRKLNKKSK